jgi:hypothetical protein
MRNDKYIISAKQNKNSKSIKNYITVILLGENHGHRMKSYGPIPLIELNKKTLLQKQVEAIKAVFPNYEIILCSGFDAKRTTEYVKENFKNDNIRIVENQLHYNSNCCESARLCLNNTMNDKILICSGNILLTPSFLSSIDYKKTSINVQQENFKSEFFISAIVNKSKLQSFCLGEKRDFWTETLYLNGQEIIDQFYSIVSNPDFKNKFIFEAVNELIKTNTINVTDIGKEKLIKLNNLKTLKRIKK